MMIDIFVAEREIHHFSSQSISIISLLLLIYEITYGIIFSFDKSKSFFSFVKKLDTSTYIFYCFLSLILIIFLYLYHVYHFKYKEKFRNNFW